MSTTAVARGQVVETFDRHRLGVISDIDEERILLRPHFGRSFWLTDGLVRSVESGRVRLHVDRRVVGRYREPMAELEQTGLRGRLSIASSIALTIVAAGLWLAL